MSRECFGLQELFECLCCFYIHEIEHLCPICLEYEDGDPHNAQDPIIKAHDLRHRLFFGAQRLLSHCSLIFFVRQTYAVNIL